MTSPSILLVEHEAPVAELVRMYLAREGFAVTVAAEPERIGPAVRRVRPAAVVVDLTMPGLAVDALRADLGAGAALLCITGDAGIRPRDLGVDGSACVPRPFSPRVLVARLLDALRPAAAEPAAGMYRSGALTIDPVSRRVRVGAREVALTGTEFALLMYLLGHPGRVHTRERLLAAVWGAGDAAGSRTVDVHIAQVRAKLGTGSPIRTVRGIGYAVDA